MKDISKTTDRKPNDPEVYNYSLLVAKKFGIANLFEKVTNEELERVRDILSKGKPTLHASYFNCQNKNSGGHKTR